MGALPCPLAFRPAPSPLVAGGSWRRIGELSQRLGLPASSCYVECRLGPAASTRVDFLVGLARGKRQALADWLSQQQAPPQGLCRMSRAWNAEPRTLLSDVSGLWLEYDDVGNGEASEPSLCACVVPGYAAHVASYPQEERRERGQRLIAAVEVLTGSALLPDVRERLDRCLVSLPEGGTAIHLSAMLGRPRAPLKLYCVLPRSTLCDFLATLGWQGPLAVIAELVERFCPEHRVAEELYVDLTLLDLDAPGGNTLGLAFAPQHLAHSLETDPGRGPLLDECVRAGLCTAAQRQALQHWPGRYEEPETLPLRAKLLITQWLDLKLVWSPTLPLLLKAYLGASCREAMTFDLADSTSAAVVV